MVKVQQVWLVVCIDNKVATTRFIVRRGKPLHNKVNNLRTEVQTFVLDIDTKLGKKNRRVIDKTFFVMHLKAYFFLAGVRQSLGKDAGIGHSKTCDHFRWAVAMYPIVSLPKQLVLIILRFFAEEFIDRLPTTVKRL